MKANLFTYGTLAPDGPEAVADGGWRPDMVRGRVFDLGPYPALVDPEDDEADWVAGFVREVDEALLAGPLDDYEGVRDGLFRRVEVETRAGRRAWVYAYAKDLPASAVGPLDRWDGPKRHGWWQDHGARLGPRASVIPDDDPGANPPAPPPRTQEQGGPA